MKQTQIQKVSDEAKARGHEVRVRDIAYAALSVIFDDEYMAFSVAFGQPQNADELKKYKAREEVKFLVRYFTSALEENKKDDKAEADAIAKLLSQDKTDVENDVTFAENKAAMITLIQRTEEALAEGKIDTDKGLKIIADIRVKLNDKFGASEEAKKNILILPPTYNLICPHTNRECYQIDKEWAKKYFNLVEKPKE
jgi:hypothetical protein